MNSPILHRARLRHFARVVVHSAVGAMLSFAIAGCASSNLRNGLLLGTVAPQPTLVQPGTELVAAQAMASQQEGDFVLQGAGESMAPLYGSGTAVVVHPMSYFMLRRGMPVVYVNRRGVSVAHVLIEKSDCGWLVMGINNAEPDDDRVTASNLVGVIRYAFAADGFGSGLSPGAVVAVNDSMGAGSPMTLLH